MSAIIFIFTFLLIIANFALHGLFIFLIDCGQSLTAILVVECLLSVFIYNRTRVKRCNQGLICSLKEGIVIIEVALECFISIGYAIGVFKVLDDP